MVFCRRFDEQMLFSKAVRERLDAEAALLSDLGTERTYWYAVRSRQNGARTIERNYDPSHQIEFFATLDPTSEQQLLAEQIGLRLNEECAHDGAWVVAYTHPPEFGHIIGVTPNYSWRRLVKLWMDQDGDVGFSLDCIDPFWQVATQSPDHFIEQGEQAWQKWHFLMRDALDPRIHQLKPLAHLKERGLA